MSLDQISVFVENKTGKLNDIIKVLAANKLDIRALTLADTAEFGILRLIAEDTISTVNALRAAGCVVSLTPVLAGQTGQPRQGAGYTGGKRRGHRVYVRFYLLH